jgi:hypothetical protein
MRSEIAKIQREKNTVHCVLTIRNSTNRRVERNEKQRKEIIDNLWSRINKQQGKKKKRSKENDNLSETDKLK